ncbi:MAG TPA: hypothetical protein VM434_03785 [Beijerinckiaceae bacterium]|nr:hypothetical protein [Beijerinckiaceae bacterium]
MSLGFIVAAAADAPGAGPADGMSMPAEAGPGPVYKDAERGPGYGPGPVYKDSERRPTYTGGPIYKDSERFSEPARAPRMHRHHHRHHAYHHRPHRGHPHGYAPAPRAYPGHAMPPRGYAPDRRAYFPPQPPRRAPVETYAPEPGAHHGPPPRRQPVAAPEVDYEAPPRGTRQSPRRVGPESYPQ